MTGIAMLPWIGRVERMKTKTPLCQQAGNLLAALAVMLALAMMMASDVLAQGLQNVQPASSDPAAVPTPVEADIAVPYVAGSESSDFIKGVDVSSLLSLLRSGVTFRDWDGSMLGTDGNIDSQGQAFMQLLASAGVNWVRLRVWNMPFNANGNGYGGGNNDLEAAKTMGKWASDAGMQVLIDFHYSDFWASAGKQKEPKEWTGISLDEKIQKIELFTEESLNSLLDAGVNVGMVQIGNETNNGICGEMYSSGWENAAKLFQAGVDAVHQVGQARGKDILAAVHFTNPEQGNYVSDYAANLKQYRVDYDVFASSYYPYWHGSLDNLTSQLRQVAETYDKKVMVAETSWATTLEDGDGHDNTVRVGSNDTDNMSGKNWPFSVQGQAQAVADVAQAVANVGENGIGMFYWEPAWLPVGNVSGLEGEAYTAQVDANKELWETYGSGWASSYASEYDPDDAGIWYGGSQVDNQSMFSFDGNPLSSLRVWTYMQTGSIVPLAAESVDNAAVTAEAGADGTASVTLPETVTVHYNDDTSAQAPVTWDTGTLDLAALEPGSYSISGTATVTQADGTLSRQVTCTITVLPHNLLENGDLESGQILTTSGNWEGKGITSEDPDHAHSGTRYLHFGSASGVQGMTAETKPMTLQAGSYTYSLFAQGEGASGSIYVQTVPAASTAFTASAAFTVSGPLDWQQPTVEFTLDKETTVVLGISVDVEAGGRGAIDDLRLNRKSGPEEPGGSEEPDPEEPGGSEKPDPEEPSNPDTPGTPDTPAGPDTPEDTGGSGNPSGGGNPQTPHASGSNPGNTAAQPDAQESAAVPLTADTLPLTEVLVLLLGAGVCLALLLASRKA